MQGNRYDARKKIAWKDIQEVVKNLEEYYTFYSVPDKAPLNLLMAVSSIYEEHMKKQTDKDLNLNVAQNRPLILRSQVIQRYKGKTPDKDLIDDYRTNKWLINRKLEELSFKKDKRQGKILNPKGLVLIASERKGRGEEANYLVPLYLHAGSTSGPKLEEAKITTPERQLQLSLAQWKDNNYSGDKTLSPPDLPKIENELDIIDLDEESRAYFFVSCVFRGHNPHLWLNKFKDQPLAVWHVVNLLMQTFRRPFWRAAFILQYVDSALFLKTIASFSGSMLRDERIMKGINAINSKSVEQYLRQHKNEELFAQELLKEFAIYRRYFERGDNKDITSR